MGGTVGRYEIAPGADKTGWLPPDSYGWVDLTSRTQDAEAVITRGRMSNQQQVMPATLPMPLDNGDAALTPRHPASTYYPHIARGLPIRYSVAAGDPYLLCDETGIGASTPDTAALHITTDITLAVCVEAPLRYRTVLPPDSYGLTESTSMNLLLKWNPTGNDRGYRLAVLSELGHLGIIWSTDGTAAGQLSLTFGTPKPAVGPCSYAIELDVNNGLGGYTGRLYVWRGTIDELMANQDAALVEEQVTTAGTTSIFSSNAVLAVGGNSSATLGRYSGGIIEARVISGDLATGTERANPDFSAQAVGATSFADATGKTWTVGAAGDITKYRPRFYGELASSGPTWPGGSTPNTSRVNWAAAGVLRRLRQNDKPLDSPMRRTVGAPVTQSQVYAYWPLDDGAQSTTAESPIPGVKPLRVGGTVSFAGDTTCPGSSPVINVSEGQIYGWQGVVPAPAVTPTSWRLEMFFKLESDAESITMVGWTTTGPTVSRIDMGVSSVNGIVLRAMDTSSGMADQTTFGWDSSWDGRWLYYSAKVTQSGADILVESNLVPLEGTTQGLAFGTTDTWTGLAYGRIKGINALAAAPTGGVSMGNLLAVDGALDLGWLANADTGWDTETATQRIWRLCAEQGVRVYVDGPIGQGLTSGIEDGVASLGPQRALPFLTLIEEAAQADLGYLSESLVDDGLCYRTGATLVNQEPVLTVGTEVTLDLAPADDDQGLVNDLTVSQTDGSRRRITDDDSIASAGWYDGNVTVNLAEADDLEGQASIRLAIATWPAMRYPNVPLELTKNEAIWPDWMRARPGDLIVADQLPDSHPEPEIRQLLDGYKESISTVRWRVIANTTPEGPWSAGVIDTDGTPDTDARALDTDGSSLDASISDVATTMVVDVTDGPLWTTDAAQYPLDLNVGGERVTATACSGASSPQTFTIVRGVDGVQVAHDAGTDVRVWQPLRLTI